MFPAAAGMYNSLPQGSTLHQVEGHHHHLLATSQAGDVLLLPPEQQPQKRAQTSSAAFEHCPCTHSQALAAGGEPGLGESEALVGPAAGVLAPCPTAGSSWRDAADGGWAAAAGGDDVLPSTLGMQQAAALFASAAEEQPGQQGASDMCQLYQHFQRQG